MSSFTEAKIIEVTNIYGRQRGRARWQAVELFYWELGYIGSGRRIVIEAGQISDGPSIPKWLKWLFGWLINVQSLMLASFIHDAMRERPGEFTKLETDATFLMCMEAADTPVVLRECAFILARLNRSRVNHQPHQPLPTVA